MNPAWELQGLTVAWPFAEDGHYHVPFVYSCNGRPFVKQLAEHSGTWFRDVRHNSNLAKPLNNFHSPQGLIDKLTRSKELAEQQRQQQLERERRAANEQKLKEQRLAQQTAKAKAASAPAKVAVDDIEDELLNTKPKSAPVKAAAKVAPVVAPKAAAKPTVTTLASAASVAAAWADAKEDSEPIARYDIPTEDLANRSRDIADNMNGACQAMVDNDASVVIHAADKSDYRWLAVRLTLCTRRIDRSYRLRHSHEVLSGGAPFLTLHPARDTALIRQ